MAKFFNKASLTYNGVVTNSNTVTGQLLETLSATKTAVMDNYTEHDGVTYVISITNTGSLPAENLSVIDNLGTYTFNTLSLIPLTYTPNSIRYYSNGVLQPAPNIGEGNTLVINGITVPDDGNVTLIYEAVVNEYAPLTVDGSITNTAVIRGGGLSQDITITETVTTRDMADLTISKAISPTTVTENGRLTYTFVIQNSGNTDAVVADNIIFRDTLDPILSELAVTFNDIAWTNTNYNYNATNGEFETRPSQITVPAATFTQDAETGIWTITPGVSTLVIAGTV